MEGPSLVIAREQLRPFERKVVLQVSGNTKVGKERLEGQRVRDIFCWGKHLVFQLDTFAMRIHFMLFGTFEAQVDGEWVTGEYRRARVPRLSLHFDNGFVNTFNCSIRFIEGAHVKRSYDFSRDVMSAQWDPVAARRRVRAQPDAEISDVLLDQDVFAGVGNIIKNEVLSLVHVGPRRKVKKLSPAELTKIVTVARAFSKQFYRWRKRYVLRAHLEVHRKSVCPHCGAKLTWEKTGKKQRWAHYCRRCQK